MKKDYRKIIHIGDKFSNLIVVELPEDINHRSKIHCQCDCGRDAFPRIDGLLSGHSTSCGCRNGKASKLQIGDRFGRLTVVNLPHKPTAKSYAVCICDCGKEVSLRIDYLVNHHTQSCGCLRAEKSSERTENLQKLFARDQLLEVIAIMSTTELHVVSSVCTGELAKMVFIYPEE